MTNQLIIYPNNNGSISVLYPALNCGLDVEEIAQKDVPAKAPYLVISANNLPTDHTFFEAFEADFSNPDGYGIGPDAWFAEKAAAEAAEQSEEASE